MWFVHVNYSSYGQLFSTEAFLSSSLKDLEKWRYVIILWQLISAIHKTALNLFYGLIQNSLLREHNGFSHFWMPIIPPTLQRIYVSRGLMVGLHAFQWGTILGRVMFKRIMACKCKQSPNIIVEDGKRRWQQLSLDCKALSCHIHYVAECFIFTMCFNLMSTLRKILLLWFPFHRWGNRGLERLGKAFPWQKNHTRIWTQVSLTPHPRFCVVLLLCCHNVSLDSPVLALSTFMPGFPPPFLSSLPGAPCSPVEL